MNTSTGHDMTTDGRELRSIRTRAAIIEAWLSWIDEGDMAPTAKQVADRAYIGLRTVFQHFSDMQALQQAAGEVQFARVSPQLNQVPADSPLPERIQLAVSTRGRLFEVTTPVRRAAMREEWNSVMIREFIDAVEQGYFEDTVRVFAKEIEALPESQRETVTLALDAALSWANWNHLCQRRELERERAEEVVCVVVTALLAQR
jgi:TetR/AcrR family transcriptional regulator, regulator of autoinduction and epiphytic fitness